MVTCIYFSFVVDIFVFYLKIFLFSNSKRQSPIFSTNSFKAGGFFVLFCFFTFQSLNHLELTGFIWCEEGIQFYLLAYDYFQPPFIIYFFISLLIWHSTSIIYQSSISIWACFWTLLFWSICVPLCQYHTLS